MKQTRRIILTEIVQELNLENIETATQKLRKSSKRESKLFSARILLAFPGSHFCVRLLLYLI